MELKIFFENLAAAFVVSYTKTPDVIKRMGSRIDDNEMDITIRREKQGLRQCINATVIEIRPDANKKHHMLCQEIWVGYDAEGDHWSDAMRGRLVDCTGMTIDQAIDRIVAVIKEMIKE
jgi:hypothetical protein